jgi:hypothetical protein
VARIQASTVSVNFYQLTLLFNFFLLKELPPKNLFISVYFDVEDMDNDIDVVIKLAKDHVNRFWDIRVCF